MEKEQLLKLIYEINSNENYFGIIPFYPVYIYANDISLLSIRDFRELLLNLEQEHKIYLETINDLTRLSIDEKNIAIYDKIRGYLFYIGLWK